MLSLGNDEALFSKANKKFITKNRIFILLLTIGIAALLLTQPASAQSPPQFLLKWGSFGAGDGQFRFPAEVAVDASGNVYVVDIDNHRIQKFDSNGNFLLKWGSLGSGDGQFSEPYGIAIDASGNVYVGDRRNSRIQKFDSNGNFLLKWGSFGPGDGQFHRPGGVAVDVSGNVYVVEHDGVSPGPNHRCQKFDSNGNFLLKWGSFGPRDGQFNRPNNIAVDASGNVYVAEGTAGIHRIQKFDSNGNFLLKWGSLGSGDGQFNVPTAIGIDVSGNVYVADHFNHRIQKFDSNGNFLLKWGSLGSGDGQFNRPYGIDFDASGNVYVSGRDNHRVQKFGITTSVDIDIKPGSDPNSIECDPSAELPVAIYSTDDFDATTVDHTTVRFGKTGTEASEIHTGGQTGGPKRHEEDRNHDGRTDLVFHFLFGDTGLGCDDTQATLTGQTFGGQAITGSDSINSVPAAPALNPRSKLTTTWAKIKTRR